MSAAASLATAAAFLLVGLPFLLAALRRARRLVPVRAAPARRWRPAEALAVFVTPFVAGPIVARLVPLEGVLGRMLESQVALLVAGLLALALAGPAPLGLASAPPPRAFLAVPLVLVPGLVCGLGLGGAWIQVCRAFGWDEQQEIMSLILGLDGGELALAAVVAVVVGPFLEELLFRGFLQTVMAQLTGERAALVLTALLFAWLHGLAGLPVLFLASLFFGWLQQRARSLWLPWSAHAVFNALMLALALGVQRG